MFILSRPSLGSLNTLREEVGRTRVLWKCARTCSTPAHALGVVDAGTKLVSVMFVSVMWQYLSSGMLDRVFIVVWWVPVCLLRIVLW